MPTYQKIVTILPSIIEISPSEDLFLVNLYGQIASRIIQNLQHKFLNMGLTPPPPPPFEQCLKNRRFGPGRRLLTSSQASQLLQPTR